MVACPCCEECCAEYACCVLKEVGLCVVVAWLCKELCWLEYVGELYALGLCVVVG